MHLFRPRQTPLLAPRRRTRFSPFLLGGLIACATLAAPAVVPSAWAKDAEKGKGKSPEDIPLGATDKEIELGKKASAELEKDPKIKLLDGTKSPENKALLDKLNGMAAELGKASARPKIKYTVKVIEDKDVNAFTLPNGNIYVYRGLLDLTGSDDEIASVLAHEIGHNARMHALRGEAKAKKLSWVSLAALAAMLAGGQSGADVAQFSQYLLTGIMNGYTVDFEKEADKAGVDEMAKTRYNPSALVSFMNRLDLEEKRHPEQELGIFRTHPPSDERAAAAIVEIKALGLQYTPRDVSGGKRAMAVETKEKDRVQIQYGSVTLMELAVPTDQLPATKARGDKIASEINDLMRDNLKMHEITAAETNDGARLMARGIEVARVLPADAKLQNQTPLQCAEKWRDSFRLLFWHETINGGL